MGKSYHILSAAHRKHAGSWNVGSVQPPPQNTCEGNFPQLARHNPEVKQASPFGTLQQLLCVPSVVALHGASSWAVWPMRL